MNVKNAAAGLLKHLSAAYQHYIARRAYRQERKRLRPATKPVTWVVGPDEIAGVLTAIADEIPGSYRASYSKHPFYELTYDYSGASGRGVSRLRMEAEHFGALAARSQGFIYIGQNGYLRSKYDARNWEFKFLRDRGVFVVCYFTGTDIRSLVKMTELERESGVPNIGSRVELLHPGLRESPTERIRKKLAVSADKYANLVFNAKRDQASYLQTATEPYMYFFNRDEILDHDSIKMKHGLGHPPVVLHAPSSPVIKGTELVRNAVKTLRDEGLEFEYVELMNASHREVVNQLRNADVVMNQFYAFMPGVFGIEAMAAGAVTLMSADPGVETDLPDGASEAWVITKYDQVTENLRQVLNLKPHERCEQALRGRDWVEQNAANSVNGPKLLRLLEKLSESV